MLEKSRAEFSVLNPWAEVDPIPVKGISPRLDALSGKTIGLYCNFKEAAKQIQSVLERRLKERFPDSKYTWYHSNMGVVDQESVRRDQMEAWIKSVDAVVLAVGD
jgi:hypothetical protein